MKKNKSNQAKEETKEAANNDPVKKEEKKEEKKLSPIEKAVNGVKGVLSDMYHDIAPVLVAVGRQGAGELGNFCAKPFPDSFGSSDAVGTPYNPTQMQVSQEIGLYGQSPAAEQPKAEAPQNEKSQTDPNVENSPEPDLEP